MKLTKILVAAIAPLITLVPQFTSIATAQELSECDLQVVGRERGSRVTMRTGPGTDFDSPGYVLVGQIVNLLNNSAGDRIHREDNEGMTWFFVEYSPSRTRGWLREDFVSRHCL